MATKFAPAERAPEGLLENQMKLFQEDEVLNRFLAKIRAVFIIVNKYRQIVYMNAGALEFAGLENLKSVLGLRPGELFNCIHSREEPGGCGTSESCQFCGAVNAILSSLEGHSDVRDCHIATDTADCKALDLRIWTSPLDIEGNRFSMITVYDVQDEKRRSALERIFFHDIMNTVGGLQGTIELLRNYGEKIDSAQFLQRAEGIVKNLVSEIRSQQILNAAESGQLQTKVTEFKILELLEGIRATFSTHDVARGKEVLVVPKIPDEKISTDQTLLRRVLGNMVKNALEAIDEGEVVTLGCELKDPERSMARFWVHNPGYIPRHIQLQIFQRSFSTKGTNRGLGTYSIRLLGSFLGGQTWFETTPEAGTTFFIELPTNKRDVEEQIPQVESQRTVIREATILLADDDPVLLGNTKLLLELNGYTVRTANNGKEAWENLEIERALPSLIVSDIEMPTMNGYDFYQKVAQDPRFNSIPFLFLSGKSSPEDIRFGKQLGVDDYLTKPVNEKDLLVTIAGKITRTRNNERFRQKIEPEIREKEISPLPETPANEPSFFSLEWDENYGPKLTDYYPYTENDRLAIEELGTNLFMISQSAYGDQGVQEAQGISLRLTNLGKDGYLYFDFYPDPEVRGGTRPFMVGVIANKIHYLASLRLSEILGDYSEKFKQKTQMGREELIRRLRNVLIVKEEKLKEVWIFSASGIELFSHAPHSDIDKDLLCNFLSAIQSFSKEISKEKLEGLSIGNDRYLFFHNDDLDFYVLGRASNLFLERTINQILGEISQAFKQKFGTALKNRLWRDEDFYEFAKDIEKWVIA